MLPNQQKQLSCQLDNKENASFSKAHSTLGRSTPKANTQRTSAKAKDKSVYWFRPLQGPLVSGAIFRGIRLIIFYGNLPALNDKPNGLPDESTDTMLMSYFKKLKRGIRF